MRIVTVRRISQIFFLVVFLWFCVAATLGGNWWQLRGWPINWILELAPPHRPGHRPGHRHPLCGPGLGPGYHRFHPVRGPVLLRLCLSFGEHQPVHRLAGEAAPGPHRPGWRPIATAAPRPGNTTSWPSCSSWPGWGSVQPGSLIPCPCCTAASIWPCCPSPRRPPGACSAPNLAVTPRFLAHRGHASGGGGFESPSSPGSSAASPAPWVCSSAS